MDLTGQKLGKYQLNERLGHGGMAEVYKAFQPGMERHVAVKVMHGHLANSPDFVTRFQREAQSIGKLQHPHILSVFDFDSDGDLYYMVMDFIRGGTLGDYLKAKGTLDTDEALRITCQLASALSFAHQQSMIHRDIKPGNVMFTDDNCTHAVLTDFGIARLLDDVMKLTVTGSMVGTPAYMSPEAAQGEPCDERSDVYSLGVVLYELVTGRTPYLAETPYSFMMKQANEPLPKPREFNSDVPEAVEALLLKALERDPAKRFQSSFDFYNEIVQVQEMISPQKKTGTFRPATPPSVTVLSQEKEKPVKMNRWIPLAAAGVGAIVIAALTVLLLLRFGDDGGQVVTDPGDTALSISQAVDEKEEPTPVETATIEAITDEAITAESTNSEAATDESANNEPVLDEPEEPTSTPIQDAAPASESESEPEITPTDETASETAKENDADSQGIDSADFSELLQGIPRRMGMVRFVDNEATPVGTILLRMDQVIQPPADSQYALWLVNESGEAGYFGEIKPEDGIVDLEIDTEQNLFNQYSQLLISIEPAGEVGELPSADILYTGRLQVETFSTMKALVAADSAKSLGFLNGAEEQVRLAIQHGDLLQESLTESNFDNVRRNAEHLVNILEGQSGKHFGELDGNGFSENPGDGVGVQKYLQDAWDVPISISDENTAKESLFYEEHAVASIENAQKLTQNVIDKTLQIFAADRINEVEPIVEELSQLLNKLLHGEDINGNGLIDSFQNEGAVLAAYDHALSMGAFPIYAEPHPLYRTQPLMSEKAGLGWLHFSLGWLRFSRSVVEGTENASPSSGASEYGGDYGGSNYSDSGYSGGDYGYNNSSPTSSSGQSATHQGTGRSKDLPNPHSFCVVEESKSNLSETFVGGYHLYAESIEPLPEGSHYAAWATNGEDDILYLGKLLFKEGIIKLDGCLDVNLLESYTGVLISVEEEDSDIERESVESIFIGQHSHEFWSLLQEFFFSGELHANGTLVGLERQAKLALDHAGFLQESLDEDNLDHAQRHAEHVINILAGKEGALFGDMDGDGMAQNPGDGVGLAGYLEKVRELILHAGEIRSQQGGIPKNFPLAIGQAVVSIDNSLQLLEEATESGAKIFASDRVDEAQPATTELIRLLEQLLEGVDLDGNGVVDPVNGEGTIFAIYDSILLMSEIGLASS